MKMKKLLSTGLAMVLAAAMLAGCGSSSQTTSTADTGDAAATTAAATAEESSAAQQETGSDEVVTLKWYMSINPVAADTDKVIEKLNEYTREKIGVEIDYTVIANPI